MCALCVFAQIRIWDTVTEKCAHAMSSLGGYVYGVAVSELAPTKVAIGVGDNSIRVWSPFAMPGRETFSFCLHSLPPDLEAGFILLQ